MIRYYLGEDPILENVETMHLVDDAICAAMPCAAAATWCSSESTARAAKPLIRPTATGAELDDLARVVEANPRRSMDQRLVAGSTYPTWVDDAMQRRHVDLRPFAVNDGRGRGGASRRPDPGRAPRRRRRGQLEPGEEGPRTPGLSAVTLQAAPATPPTRSPAAGPRWTSGPRGDDELGVQQQQQQQQQQRQQQEQERPQRDAHGTTAGSADMTSALLSHLVARLDLLGRALHRATPRGPPRPADVLVHQALEQSDDEGSSAARRLTAVMGLPDSGTETLWQATERLATRTRQPLLHCRCVGWGEGERRGGTPPRRPRRVLGAPSTPPGAAADAMGHRREVARSTSRTSRSSAQGMMGLADTMMSRDQTWLFFTLGRCFSSGPTSWPASWPPSTEEEKSSTAVWSCFLRSCGGYEPYLRLSQGVVEPGRVLDFLLRDQPLSSFSFCVTDPHRGCLGGTRRGAPGHLGRPAGPDRPGTSGAGIFSAGDAGTRDINITSCGSRRPPPLSATR